MILVPEDTERFYRIWFALLHSVNEQRRLVPSFPATCDEVPITKVKKLRDALWADDAVREDFLDTNPAGLPPADLETVASWQHRVMSFGTLEQHVETIGRFARWLLEEEPPRGLLELTGQDARRYLQTQGSGANWVSFRRFVRFLAATGRLDYTLAEDLVESLKQ